MSHSRTSAALGLAATLLLVACNGSVTDDGEGDAASSVSALSAASSAASVAVSSEASVASSAASAEASSAEASSAPAAQGEPRVITITADNWTFAPAVITAKKGEKITLSITSATGMHGFAVPGLGINVSVAAGETVTVELPTDTAGVYDVFCSIPCGAGHRDMKAQVVIEE